MNTPKGTTPKALQLKEIINTTRTNNNGFGESFRVLYYGKASSVPFMWESQPGTPKHAFSESSLPPLTPPPSYNQFSQKYNHRSSNKSPGFLRTIFLDKYSSSRKTSSFSSASVSSSSSSSSSMYMHSAPVTPKRRKMSAPVKFGLEDDCGSPTSTLCLGGHHGIKKGGYRIKKFKKAMLSFVSCGR